MRCLNIMELERKKVPMKKQTKLFKHFITILNIIALSMPILVFVYYVVANGLNLHMTADAMQYHGYEGQSTFESDFDYAKENLVPTNVNMNLLYTLDNFGYLNYDAYNTDLTTWLSNYEGASYQSIVQNGVSTKMLLDVDFTSLFFENGLVNYSGSVAPYLMLNYMCNYFINISLIIFIPELLVLFIYILRNLAYKFVDKMD